MKVLVAHGSKRGGTEGLAGMIGDELADVGFDVSVRPAREVRDVGDADAVVVAGALYAGRWHRDARRLVRRQAAALRARPVWLVASGPLDDSARDRDLPPVRHVAAAMQKIGARGEVTFGGRLAPDARGFPASAMAKTRAGDWRDRDEVHRWVTGVATELAGLRLPSAAD